jgi:hypothetical protein
MDIILANHRASDFRSCILEELPFKIPVDYPDLLRAFPDHFEAGKWKASIAIAAYVYKDVSGDSEQSVISRDDSWMAILQAAISGISIYRDKLHSSSRPYLRPEATICRNNVLVLKYEAKYANTDLDIAEDELIKKFAPDASSVFPLGCNFVIGITSSIQFTKIHSISYNAHSFKFEVSTLRVHDVSNIAGRVDFIVDFFKLLRWIASVERPNAGFHLIPGVRQKTPNGHFITWTALGLLKEFNATVTQKVISHIRKVYSKHLDHVEWGVVNDDTRSVIITRVGIRIQCAIGDGLISRQRVFQDIRLALDELHGIGYAHCDVALRNIFFDKSTGTAFLNDLEYLTRLTRPPPITINNPMGLNTALALDESQYNILKLELL